MAIFLNILIVAYHIRVVNEKNVKFKKKSYFRIDSDNFMQLLRNKCISRMVL